MVRFRFSYLKLDEKYLFLPDYDSEWVEYDPNNPNAPCVSRSWQSVWAKEKGRDFVHRANMKYIARYTTNGDPVSTSTSGTYSTLAIILCFVIVACIIVPQIVQIFSALFFPASKPPPTPPSPPPVPKSRKRLRIYHFRHSLKKKSV